MEREVSKDGSKDPLNPFIDLYTLYLYIIYLKFYVSKYATYIYILFIAASQRPQSKQHCFPG